MDLYYAVGDIHGQFDAFEKLIELVRGDMQSQPKGVKCHFIQLGDLVDRGPKSKEVVEFCKSIDVHLPEASNAIVLKGNHEEHFVNVVKGKDERIVLDWYKHEHGCGGGVRTLESYGADSMGEDVQKILSESQRCVPLDHLNYLDSLPTSWSHGNYFFCHAGVEPGVPLRHQKDRALMWIRDAFMDYEKSHEKVIVHGHTPRREGQLRHNRVNADAGAGYNLKLKCFILSEQYNPQLVRSLEVDIDAPSDWRVG